MSKVFCIISHTHWDREWYLPHEQFRIKLVELLDHLLELLQKYPDYIFHLDAQTIVLEDYLEVKPQNKELLRKYVAVGNLIIGPWYVQNDFYLTSGESTIRNFLTGIRIAWEYGACERVGYMPDQFGLMGQLPQILAGFHIDNCIFGRGYNGVMPAYGDKITDKRSEFLWEGVDGTKCLAIWMPFWYNNAQRFSEDQSKSMKLLRKIEQDFEGIAFTPYLLLMNGVDHLEAQENLPLILEELKPYMPEGYGIRQTTMTYYVEQVKAYYRMMDDLEPALLPVHKGELRGGNNYHILQGTLSSRVYLKQLNNEAQNILENRLEPLYSFMELVGAKGVYPGDYLKYCWKLLIQNHPHDSICGCSRDEVHRHMEDRYERIFEISSELERRGMEFLAFHTVQKGFGSQDYLVTVFNSLQTARSEVVTVELQFPRNEGFEGFELLDPQLQRVEYEMISNGSKQRDILSAINLPGVIEVDFYVVRLLVNELPGFSQRTYIVKRSNTSVNVAADNAEIDGSVFMENEFLRVWIQENGRIDLEDKLGSRRFEDILWLEDQGDCGDSYVYGELEIDEIISTRGLQPKSIICLNETELLKEYELKYDLLLPAGFDGDQNKRSSKQLCNLVSIKLSLFAGSRILEFNVKISNQSRDHRLRAMINTGLVSNYTHSLAPFEMVERDRREQLSGIANGDQPNSGFIRIEDDKTAVSILNKGLYEYSHLSQENGIVAVTLLRGNGFISKGSTGDHWRVPGNQCLRELIMELGLYPSSAAEPVGEGVKRFQQYNNRILTCFQSADRTKFTGGRPAVQDTEINEIFFRKDPYSCLLLQLEHQEIAVQGDNIVVTAVKQAEDGSGIVLRFYNTGNTAEKAIFQFPSAFREVYLVNLEEYVQHRLVLDNGRLEFWVQPLKIVTLLMKSL